jgi:predicted regulator of Ras-like GTPase activity (Roadblock/LC7/MglB family)
MSKIDDLLQEVRTEIGSDFISTDVVGMDGLSIGGIATAPDFDAAAASARFAMVMRLAKNVSGKIQMGSVDDSLVTGKQAYILTRFLGDESYYWGLAVTRDAVLGVVRMVMEDYADQIWDAIPR